MNANLETGSSPKIETGTQAAVENSATSQTAEPHAVDHASEADLKFASELGWLTSASVTIASIAAGLS